MGEVRREPKALKSVRTRKVGWRLEEGVFLRFRGFWHLVSASREALTASSPPPGAPGGTLLKENTLLPRARCRVVG